VHEKLVNKQVLGFKVFRFQFGTETDVEFVCLPSRNSTLVGVTAGAASYFTMMPHALSFMGTLVYSGFDHQLTFMAGPN